jgi:hypothetical protein
MSYILWGLLGIFAVFVVAFAFLLLTIDGDMEGY